MGQMHVFGQMFSSGGICAPGFQLSSFTRRVLNVNKKHVSECTLSSYGTHVTEGKLSSFGMPVVECQLNSIQKVL